MKMLMSLAAWCYQTVIWLLMASLLVSMVNDGLACAQPDGRRGRLSKTGALRGAPTTLPEKPSQDVRIEDGHEELLYCRRQATKHKIVFGESWGTMLDPQDQQVWIKYNCDQYFCAKNKLAGKGIYKCIPIDGKKRNKRHQNPHKFAVSGSSNQQVNGDDTEVNVDAAAAKTDI